MPMASTSEACQSAFRGLPLDMNPRVQPDRPLQENASTSWAYATLPGLLFSNARDFTTDKPIPPILVIRTKIGARRLRREGFLDFAHLHIAQQTHFEALQQQVELGGFLEFLDRGRGGRQRGTGNHWPMVGQQHGAM